MADKELEARFYRKMMDDVRAAQNLGYNPTAFVRMMNERGVVRVVHDLLDTPNQSEGFGRLWEMNRLDLTAEAVALDQQWADLFTDSQREVARQRLERVGYQVPPAAAPPAAVATEPTSNVGTDWTVAECVATVADYFDMLAAELRGRPQKKSEHNRQLRQTVLRSSGSIEFKHANISAVLVEMQQPYLRGYNPRGHYQRRLAEAVVNYLDQNPEFFTTPEVLAAIEPTASPAVVLAAVAEVFDSPPEIVLPISEATPWLSRRGRRVNFAERDARNRDLGRRGEQFALDLERRSLRDAGRDDLAARVEWVADTWGDGVGFDVLSFDPAGEGEKWVEVKTTTLGKYHPFLVTANEVRCSQAEPGRFHLYRVFDFRLTPRVYVLPGALSARCELRPTQYTAAPRQA